HKGVRRVSHERSGDGGELTVEGNVEGTGEVRGHERAAIPPGVEDDRLGEGIEGLYFQRRGRRHGGEAGYAVAVEPLHPREVERRLGLPVEEGADERGFRASRGGEGGVEPPLVAQRRLRHGSQRLPAGG